MENLKDLESKIKSIEDEDFSLIELVKRENDFLLEEVKGSHALILRLLDRISQLQDALKQPVPAQ